MSQAARAAEAAARAAYGKLLARLVARTRDIAAAEDALADAFAAALANWPVRGVPDSPEAWLLTAARRANANAARHARVQRAWGPEWLRRATAPVDAEDGYPDPRLKLLFACAHPAIDPAVRTPLMLQTVLGLDAARIAAAFAISPTAMGQRLSRAKARIRDAGLRYTVPDPAEMPARLAEVLDAVYAAFGSAKDDPNDGGTQALAEEAIWLGRLLVALLPDAPEAKGLLALMLHVEARRAARQDAEGRFVPLAAQDPTRWRRDLIIEAEGLLVAGAQAGRFGRFLCEAAIQSVHAQRGITGRTNHAALLTLYGLLLAHGAGMGAAVARAAVLLEAGDLPAARAGLAAVPEPARARYQPWWVASARVHRAAGEMAEAGAALEMALALTEAPAVAAFLRDWAASLEN